MGTGRIALLLLATSTAVDADTGRRTDPSRSYFPIPIHRDRAFEYIPWSGIFLRITEHLPANARITEVVDGRVRTGELGKDGVPTFWFGLFVLRAAEHEVRILQNRGNGHYVQRSAFKRALSDGMKWTAAEVGGWDGVTTFDRECVVTSEKIEGMAGIFDTLRIDVLSNGVKRESIWLARGVGLVQWQVEEYPLPLQWTGFTLEGPPPVPLPAPAQILELEGFLRG